MCRMPVRLLLLQYPPNGGWHRWQHDAQLPSNLVIEQHGSQSSSCCPQGIDGAEPCSLRGVHPEPRVRIGAFELRYHRGGEDQRVAEAEVPQHGREDRQEQFGVVNLQYIYFFFRRERVSENKSLEFCNIVFTDNHGGMLKAWSEILHFNNMFSKGMFTFTHI